MSSFGSSGALTVGSYTATGSMQIKPADQYGGAGGIGKYGFTGANGVLSVDLTTPSKYLGLWFSCANTNNYVDVYSGGNLLATFDTKSLTDIVGPKATPNSVLASDGNTYTGNNWYGNPNPPYNANPYAADVGRFIYAYVNMGLSDPSATFDKIVIRGDYFEFDNLTASSAAFTPVIPEPSTYMLFGLGALALVIVYRRKMA